jgi:hypothetical protein
VDFSVTVGTEGDALGDFFEDASDGEFGIEHGADDPVFLLYSASRV